MIIITITTIITIIIIIITIIIIIYEILHFFNLKKYARYHMTPTQHNQKKNSSNKLLKNKFKNVNSIS